MHPTQALEPLKDTAEGVVLPLYQYLWSKNKQGEACGVCIPHTVCIAAVQQRV